MTTSLTPSTPRFDPTNHHNALLCPYCQHGAVAQRDRLRDAPRIAERWLRMAHLLDHPNCEPGPVENCRTALYADDWRAIQEARAALTDPEAPTDG